MRGCVRTGNQDVVDVGEAEEETTQDFIHESLEGLCRLLQTERHPGVLVQGKECNDGCLRDVRKFYGDLMDGLNEVDPSEDGGAVELRREFLDVGHRVTIHLGAGV